MSKLMHGAITAALLGITAGLCCGWAVAQPVAHGPNPAPASSPCGVRDGRPPTECTAPRAMRFSFLGVALGQRLSAAPQMDGALCEARKADEATLAAPLHCRWETKAGQYRADVRVRTGSDGIVEEISAEFASMTDRDFSGLRDDLTRQFGPPTLVMDYFLDAQWQSTDGSDTKIVRSPVGHSNDVVLSMLTPEGRKASEERLRAKQNQAP